MREEQVPRPLGKSFLTRRKGVKVNNCTEGRKGKCRKGGTEEELLDEFRGRGNNCLLGGGAMRIKPHFLGGKSHILTPHSKAFLPRPSPKE